MSALLVLSGAIAYAEPPPPPTLTESLAGAAKEAYTAATLLVANHDFAGASTKLAQAYDLSRDPRLLFDMAICEKNLRHYARMESLLRRYREEGKLTAEAKQTVDDALAAIDALVGRVTVSSNQPGAAVLLDGEVVGITPLGHSLTVDLGKHALTVRKEGFTPAERTFETSGGGELTIDVALTIAAEWATLRITTAPDATVLVDGRIAGKGRYDGRVRPGFHEVRVTDAERSLVPWLVGGGVAVAAGLAVGGYFLLKPHDQAAAPPSGRLGTVQFATWGR